MGFEFYKDQMGFPIVGSVTGLQVDNTDPENPILPEFAYPNGSNTTGGIWWIDQILSDRLPNYKQVLTVLNNNTIEYGNLELLQHRFIVEDKDGIKIVTGGNTGILWNSLNLTNVSQLNNDAGYLQSNDLDGFVYNVTYTSNNHVLTFFRQNQPNIVVDLPIEQLITGVQLVGDDLVFTFEDGSTVTVPMNTLLVGVVKSVNGLTPNSQGEIILQITDIPGLQSALNGKVNLSGNNATGDLLEAIDWRHQHANKSVLDNLTQSVINNSHTHGNKALLDTYNQTNANITDAVNKRHDAVTLGTNTNGLSLAAQVLSLALATSLSAGAMSSADKTKLDNIAPNANNYVLPTASTTVLGGIRVGTNLSIDANGVLSSSYVNTTYSAGNGLTLAGTVFSLPVAQTGTGNAVTAVTQTTNGITVTKGATFLTSFTETDPTVPAWVKSITTGDITNWNNKQNALSNGLHTTLSSNQVNVVLETSTPLRDKAGFERISVGGTSTNDDFIFYSRFPDTTGFSWRDASGNIHMELQAGGILRIAENSGTGNRLAFFDSAGSLFDSSIDPTNIALQSGSYPQMSVGSANVLTTPRIINGTAFNGSANIVTDYWGTARNITIGNTTKSVNGSANVSWSLAEIGIPTSSDFITTNTNQTGLTGNKTTSGQWVYAGTSAYMLTVKRTNSTGNNTISFLDQNNEGFNLGMANKDAFALGSSADLSNATNRWFEVRRTGLMVVRGSGAGYAINGQNDTQILLAGGGHRPVSDFALANGSNLSGYFPTNFNNSVNSIAYTGDLLNVPNGSYSAVLSSTATNLPYNQPGGLISFGSSVLSTRILGARDNSDNLWFQSGDGTGAWRQLASREWADNKFALASSIITPNNGLLTISTSADLTGGGTFSADQATASNVNIGLSSSALASLALADTAVQPSALNNYYQSGDVNIPAIGGDYRVFPYGDSAALFDLDTITEHGFYKNMTNNTNTNSPKTGYWYIENHKYANSGNLTQYAHPYRVSDGKWMRSRFGGTWTPWVEFIHSDNLDNYAANLGYIKSAPAQVNIIQGTGIAVSGTYPNITITNSAPNATHTGDVTGSTALTIANGVVSNGKLAVMAANTFKGRISTAGAPQDLTVAQVLTMLNVQAGANNYTHPNHTGDVTSVGDGATTIVNNAVTFAKMQNIAANTFLGRITTGTGNIEALTVSQMQAALGINTYTGSASIIQVGTSFQRAAITGDVTAGQNSNVLTLINTGVTAGTYNQVTVNSKGLVTNATNVPTGIKNIWTDNSALPGPTNSQDITLMSHETWGLPMALYRSPDFAGNALFEADSDQIHIYANYDSTVHFDLTSDFILNPSSELMHHYTFHIKSNNVRLTLQPGVYTGDRVYIVVAGSYSGVVIDGDILSAGGTGSIDGVAGGVSFIWNPELGLWVQTA